ncbi:unnamed protein product [Paramecium primaurelia]|uniref:Tetratricopeptide repeat protein n=1 Tax=Paramecium primaurelia TaxID=5886 RepID=A0A8S1L7S4_PARPR|nr:unnamed protein product [Paramecium primaurelia]
MKKRFIIKQGVLINLVAVFYRKNIFMKAQKNCEICIKIIPKQSLAYMRIGQESPFQLECVKNEIGNKDDTLQYYNQAIEIDKKSILAYCNRVYNDQVLFDYNKVIELDIQYAFAYMSRESQVIQLNRKFLYQIGNYEEKLLDFSKAIGLDLYDACIYNSRGLLNYQVKQDFYLLKLQILIRHLQLLRRQLNQILIVLIFISIEVINIQFWLGIFMKTQIMNNKAIELDPNNSEAYNKRGVKISIMKQAVFFNINLETHKLHKLQQIK